jgi:ribonucleotide reductase alpha subunit
MMVRHLDNLIDINVLSIPEANKSDKENRAVGLGVMGFADTIERLGMAYDSEHAWDFADRIFEFVSYMAIDESANLAQSAVSTKISKVRNGQRVMFRSTLSKRSMKLPRRAGFSSSRKQTQGSQLESPPRKSKGNAKRHTHGRRSKCKHRSCCRNNSGHRRSICSGFFSK